MLEFESMTTALRRISISCSRYHSSLIARNSQIVRNLRYCSSKSDNTTQSIPDEPDILIVPESKIDDQEAIQGDDMEETEESTQEMSKVSVTAGVGILADPNPTKSEEESTELPIEPESSIHIEVPPNTININEPEMKYSDNEESTTVAEEEDFWSKWKKYFQRKMTPKIGWWLNFGNGLAIISIAMEEMLQLRCLLAGANLCVFMFYRSQSPPMKLPSYWALFFLCGHSVMAIRLLLENRSVDLSDIEHEVYCNAFREYGFTPFQFKRIMSIAKYMRVDKGDIICNENKEKKTVMYVLGSMELKQNGRNVGGLINGFVGDLVPNNSKPQKTKHNNEKFLEEESSNDQLNESTETKKLESEPHMKIVSDVVELSDFAEQNEAGSVPKKTEQANKDSENISIAQKLTKIMDENDVDRYDPNIWHHTVVALESSTIFVWDRNALHKLLTSDARSKAAAEKAVGGDLRHKLKTDKKFNSIKTYRSLLEIVMYDGSIVNEEKQRLNQFRQDNHISIGEHEEVVQSLGWNMDEYDRGLKDVTSITSKLRNWYLLNMTTRYTTD